MKVFKLFNVVAILILIGCKENPMESNGNLTAETNGTNFSAPATMIPRIIVTLKNNTKKIVYIFHCNGNVGVYFETKYSDSLSWVDYGSIAINCSEIYPSGTIPLGPMQSMADTIYYNCPYATYRLRYPYSWNQDGHNQEYLFSNEFNYGVLFYK
jgi:hypothetical protein